MEIKEKRREEIIKAAIKVFSRYGYDGAKIEAIANEAGIGKGTIYEYFCSKKQLFEEMLCFCIDEYMSALQRLIDSSEDIRDKLKNIIKYHISFFQEHMDMFYMTFHSNNISKETHAVLIKKRDQLFRILEEIINDRILKREFRQGLDKRAVILCIIGAVNQFAVDSVFIQKKGIDSIDCEGVLDILLNGLTA